MRTDITQAERDALIIVRDALRSGKLVHVHTPTLPLDFVETGKVRIRTAKLPFNMATSGAMTPCGTMACIGGWMYVAMQRPSLNEPSLDLDAMKKYVWEDRSFALEDLFFQDSNPTRPLEDITSAQAANLIDEFLDAYI